MKHQLTMNIKGEYLLQIINREKKIEYRDIKPHWDVRIAKCKTPFLLRLVNGYSPDAPEITIEVLKVRKDKRISANRPTGVYCLYLGKIKSDKHIDNLTQEES